MSYTAQNIRNICLLGHSGSGKTTLCESLLFVTGAIDRMGKTPDGNTVSDYDPEEVKRQVSISLAVAPVEYKGCKINVLDAPGNFDFAGEVVQALCAADAAILVCSAKDGVSVGLERAWKYCEERGLPRLIYVSKTDEDNADYSATVEALREKYGNSIAPVAAPAPDGSCVVDLVVNKAYQMGKGGKRTEVSIPGGMADQVENLRAELMEAAAGTDEELMEKFFDAMELTSEETAKGVAIGVRDGSLVPVLCGSAIAGLGSAMLLDNVIALVPDPTQGKPLPAEEGEAVVDPSGAPAAFVFKTVADQYGKFSLIKVISGNVTSDMTLVNSTTGANEKLGRLYIMRGKKSEEVKELVCGDIGAIGKMDKVRTGDTLSDARKGLKLAPIPFAEPNFSKAIAPKTRGQEDKIAAGLGRLNEEDPTFTMVNNAETHQMVITAAGDIQMDVLVSKLKSRFNVDVELSEPRVAYREKIRKSVSKQGRHKKQTGGSGQFGDVWIRFEPCESETLEFAEEVVGGAVPKNFFPAVEKGLREACVHGVLAGYPMVNLKATLYDGSYHPVDSSEIAFKTAAQLAYKAALPEASPILLEPVGELKVTIPDSYMGDVMGDITKRRGRVLGMNPAGDGTQTLEAEVPMAEMMSYAIDLRAMTQSRGTFTLHFVRYEECPGPAQEKAIAAAKAMAEE